MDQPEWLTRVAKGMGQASLSSAAALPYVLAVVSVVGFFGTVAATDNPVALIGAFVFAAVTVTNAVISWHRCFNKDPRLLRSERYNVQMTQLEMLGDSKVGLGNTSRAAIDLKPAASSPALEELPKGDDT